MKSALEIKFIIIIIIIMCGNKLQNTQVNLQLRLSHEQISFLLNHTGVVRHVLNFKQASCAAEETNKHLALHMRNMTWHMLICLPVETPVNRL